MVALDASALLAYLFTERGHEKVEAVIDDCCLSSVNLAEVASRFSRDGHDATEVVERIADSNIEIAGFGIDDAALVAKLLPPTQMHGLSLGDRACLALAMARGIPAITADRVWAKLDLPVQIQIIRNQDE